MNTHLYYLFMQASTLSTQSLPTSTSTYQLSVLSKDICKDIYIMVHILHDIL